MSIKAGKGPLASLLVSLLAFTLVSACFAVIRENIVPYDANKARAMWYLGGDEPSYLMTAYSIAHDRDLDVSNNIQDKAWSSFAGRDYWGTFHGSLEFYKRLSPAIKEHEQGRWNGARYLVHRPGLSLLIAPATLSKTRVRWWAYFIITQVSALLLAVIIWSSAKAGYNVWKIAALGMLFTFAPPGFFYLNQAFPAIPSAMMLALGFTLLLNPTHLRVIVTVFIVIAAPWFADRSIFAAVLLGMACLVYSPDKKTTVFCLIMFLAGGLALAQYYFHRFGVPFPVDHSPVVKASPNRIPSQLVPVLMDSTKGILFLAPFLIFTPVAFIQWWRLGHHRVLCVLSAMALLATLLLTASNSDWSGGSGPVGRYGVMLMWLSFPAFVVWTGSRLTMRQKIMVTPLMVFCIIEWFVLYNHFQWWFSKANPLLNIEWLRWSSTALPNFMFGDAGQELVKAGIWGLVFIAYVVLSTNLINFHRRER